MKHFSVIAAVDNHFGISKDGRIPWRHKEDLTHFKKLTTGNTVVMSYSTWISIGSKPLTDRLNLIISPSGHTVDNFNCFLSLEDTLRWCYAHAPTKKVFVIGGGKLYHRAICHDLCEEIHLSHIFGDYQCDNFLLENHKDHRGTLAQIDEIDLCDCDFCMTKRYQFSLKTETVCSDWKYKFYTRRNADEEQYLDLINRVIRCGIYKSDRTGTGTIGLFGKQMIYDLSNNKLPLLTTKSMFWKGVVEELLWMIRGSTDSKILEAKGVNIWKGNTTREFLDQRNLKDYFVGNCGPIYGFQWRHCGAEYIGCDVDYTGQGIDQLQNAINLIKTDPTSRRIVVSAWNPVDFDKMCLPPCHTMMQFYVDPEKKKLSCMMTQRSCDVGLGVPFNIASYSLLTILISHICGLFPDKFIHNLGDTHVYRDHAEELLKQAQRVPYPFPTVCITKMSDNIDDYTSDDIQLLNYQHFPAIRLKMAV